MEYLAGWILWEPIHTCALEMKGNPEQLALRVVLEVPNEDRSLLFMGIEKNTFVCSKAAY